MAKTETHTVRGFAEFRARRGWHRLITLACLLSFVFAAAAHAGHHLAIAGEAAMVATTNAPMDGSGDGDGGKDGVCVFCALAAAELPSMPVIAGDTLRVLVETRQTALTPRVRAAEYPPPIT